MAPLTALYVEPINPVACASVLWRRGAALFATIIVKATFELVHGRAAKLVAPAAIVHKDRPRQNDPWNSLEEASEIAPYLPRAEVLLSGAAHALPGRPVPASAVRLALFSKQPLLDKTLHIYGDRSYDSASEPLPFQTMPIVYERAFGGPGVDENPAGTNAEPDSPLLPNIVDPADARKPAGFGPISMHWRSRTHRLDEKTRAGIARPILEISEHLDWSYFHSAPADQRLAYLRGDEWIVLDGMHPSLPRVETHLPWVGARAKRYTLTTGGALEASDINLVGDMLVIDAERGVCSVIWRGHIRLANEDEAQRTRVFAGIEQPGASILWPEPAEVGRLWERGGHSAAQAPEEEEATVAQGDITLEGTESPADPKRPVTPFAIPPAGQRSGGDARHVPGAPWSPVAAAPRPRPAELADSTVALEPEAPAIRTVIEAARADPPPMHSFGFYNNPIEFKPLVEPPEPPPKPPSGWLGPPTLTGEEDVQHLLAAIPFLGRVEAETSEQAAPTAASILRAKAVAALKERALFDSMDLAGADLRKLDFTGCSMIRCILKGARLEGATLTSALLRGAQMSGADLTGALLDGADLTGADLTRALLARATLERTALSDANFSEAQGPGARFDGARGDRISFAKGAWDGASFKGLTAAHVDFTRASIEGASFNAALLTDICLEDARGGATFDDATLPKTRASRASLAKSSFKRADARGSIFQKATLSEAHFHGAKLQGSTFARAIAEKADFSGADLSEGQLRHAKLDGANFTGAILKTAKLQRITAPFADLSRAKMEGADLRQAIMTNASFVEASMPKSWAEEAKLDGARFDRADLRGACLRSASLSGAILARANLEAADLRDANLERANIFEARRQDARMTGANVKGLSEAEPGPLRSSK